MLKTLIISFVAVGIGMGIGTLIRHRLRRGDNSTPDGSARSEGTDVAPAAQDDAD